MVNKEKCFVSCVIYVHNSQDTIEYFMNNLIETIENYFENSEVICVNDASSDKSCEKIREIAKKAHSTSVSIINLGVYHGVESAMNAGRDASIGDYVFEFDNTLMDYEKSMIMNAYNKMLEGYDIVNVAPENNERLSSRIFYRILNYSSSVKYEKCTEVFRITSRRLINRISSINRTVLYRKIAYANNGLKNYTLRYHSDKTKKRSTSHNKHNFDSAVNTLVVFTNLGFSVSVGMTLLMMVFLFAMVIYSIVIRIMGIPVPGWTSTILFLSICFLGLFTIIAVMIKYLQLIVDLEVKKKFYVYESIEKITK